MIGSCARANTELVGSLGAAPHTAGKREGETLSQRDASAQKKTGKIRSASSLYEPEYEYN
jgi:hypothetical protein